MTEKRSWGFSRYIIGAALSLMVFFIEKGATVLELNHADNAGLKAEMHAMNARLSDMEGIVRRYSDLNARVAVLEYATHIRPRTKKTDFSAAKERPWGLTARNASKGE